MTTLSELITRCRQRADYEDNEHVSDSEIITYINESALRLYDILVQTFMDDYFATTYEFTTVQGQQSYSLPSDFYKALGVDIKLDGSNYIPMKKFNFKDRNRYSTIATGTLQGMSNLRYRLIGSTLYIAPNPQGALPVQLWYVPSFTKLASTTDVLSTPVEYDEFVVIDTAIKILAKEESDTSLLYRQRKDILDMIQDAAQNRDAGESDSITDVYRDYRDEANDWI